jgi:esterase/lipase superfamily enzyme
MHREYVAWDSPTLGRRMEMLWFGQGGRPMIWFPTSAGRFYQNEDFGLIGAVGDLIDGGALQVACVDSVDEESFYAKKRHPSERIRRHDQYDRYIYSEVVPYVRGRAGTNARVGTLGASFGAYHAANFGFRHPDVVDRVVGFSGKYDIHSFLDGYWDQLCYFHCPTAYVPNMDGEWVAKLSSMDIAIVTGQTDNILSGTTDMLRILNEKGIRNRGSVWDAPYGHDWPWWKVQIRSYVS